MKIEENDQEYGTVNHNYTTFTMKGVRMGFVKKVFGILSIQMLITASLILYAINQDGFVKFANQNTYLQILCQIILLCILLTLLCCNKFFKKFPLNYFLLFTFTLCESYLVSILCANSDPKDVLISASLTCSVVICLTLYAWITDTDFTTFGGILFVLGIIFIGGSIILIFIKSKVFYIIMTCLGIFLFSLYIIYDVQLIIGKGRYSLDYDDYAIGALILYIDIINLFLEILSLTNATRG